MPETIGFEFALAIGACLVTVIGVLVWALSHLYFMLIQKSITTIGAKVEILSEDVKDSSEKLHTRITEHIERYHAS